MVIFIGNPCRSTFYGTTFFGLIASSSSEDRITWKSSCASCSSGGMTQPSACNARRTAPGEYGSERNVG